MKWISTKEKLPPTHRTVLVCRELRISGIDPILTHDIGMLDGTDANDRWRLESQNYSPLPVNPTLSSGIITHWMELPELPNKER